MVWAVLSLIESWIQSRGPRFFLTFSSPSKRATSHLLSLGNKQNQTPPGPRKLVTKLRITESLMWGQLGVRGRLAFFGEVQRTPGSARRAPVLLGCPALSATRLIRTRRAERSGRERIQPAGGLASGRASSACSAQGFGARKGSATDPRGSQTRRTDPSSPLRHGVAELQY